jgi:hypothetical protein
MPTLKRIYIYRESHLPENGWLQACFRCKSITGKYILFETFYHNNYLYEFYIHICGHCNQHFERNKTSYLTFASDCSTYIRDNYPQLFHK